jgi:hypothetical protein
MFIKYKNEYILIKKIAAGIFIPSFVLWFWLSSTYNPFPELLLIIKGKITKGMITSIEQNIEEVSYNDDRSSGLRINYYYEFHFFLENGLKITSFGSEEGEIPDSLSKVNIQPYQVNVEYLVSNPCINRVTNMNESNNTIFEWIKKRFILGFFPFLISIYLGVSLIKNGFNNYKLFLSTPTKSDE